MGFRVSKDELEKRKNGIFNQSFSVMELDIDDPLAVDAVALAQKMNNINLIIKVPIMKTFFSFE